MEKFWYAKREPPRKRTQKQLAALAAASGWQGVGAAHDGVLVLRTKISPVEKKNLAFMYGGKTAKITNKLKDEPLHCRGSSSPKW